MSNLGAIVSQARQLAEKIKQKEQTSKAKSGANAALIRKLTEMERAYNKSSQQQMPDYSTLLPAAPEVKEPVVKSQAQLMKEASTAVKQQAGQYRKQTLEKAGEKLGSLEEQQLQTAEKQHRELDNAYAAFEQGRQQISDASIRQGLTHSTIKNEWQRLNTGEYLTDFEDIKQRYDARIAELSRQMEAVNTAKLQSLADYNLKQAAEYENTLSRLTAEQVKEIEKINEYNKQTLSQQQQRQKQVAALEEKWRAEQQQKLKEQQEKERLDGYSGEKELEMRRRYDTALNFYKSMDKKEALRLIEENKGDLRNMLGLYFDRLLSDIGG
ncbi:MAG: hypothetical protein PHC84_02090 [Clostridia bacterium]|nr:hypothetical protein [Clostridia bacterium]